MKYGEQGLEFAVGLRSRPDLLLADVYNSGKPIPEEHRPFLFERLKTFRAGEARKSQGLGMGLHMVRQAVTRHGGEIRYEARGDRNGGWIKPNRRGPKEKSDRAGTRSYRKGC